MDDSEIVITKKLSGGGSSVRIRIGGSARSPTEQVRWCQVLVMMVKEVDDDYEDGDDDEDDDETAMSLLR